MQLKWFEDFVALAELRSFSKAAEVRHVTHPAFGRRIKALEAWAGTALIVRGSTPVTLTVAGSHLLKDAHDLLRGVTHAKDALQVAAGQKARTVTLATGRTLARTLVADWLVRLQPLLKKTQGELQIKTRSLAETAQMLERGEVDFMLTYHHPLLAVQLSARQYSYLTMAKDRLVPVTRSDARGQNLHELQSGTTTPYLAYAGSLALGRLVDDHLANHPQAPSLRRLVECDSADALLEYALLGLGMAWLPRSLAAGPIQSGQLSVIGDAMLGIDFEARLYRSKQPLSLLAEEVWKLAQPGAL